MADPVCGQGCSGLAALEARMEAHEAAQSERLESGARRMERCEEVLAQSVKDLQREVTGLRDVVERGRGVLWVLVALGGVAALVLTAYKALRG